MMHARAMQMAVASVRIRRRRRRLIYVASLARNWLSLLEAAHCEPHSAHRRTVWSSRTVGTLCAKRVS